MSVLIIFLLSRLICMRVCPCMRVERNDHYYLCSVQNLGQMYCIMCWYVTQNNVCSKIVYIIIILFLDLNVHYLDTILRCRQFNFGKTKISSVFGARERHFSMKHSSHNFSKESSSNKKQHQSFRIHCCFLAPAENNLLLFNKGTTT